MNLSSSANVNSFEPSYVNDIYWSPWVAVTVVQSAVGIVTNVLLVLCLWVHKPLHESGGYLIGMLGLFDLAANITNLIAPLTVAGGLVWQYSNCTFAAFSFCYRLTWMQLFFGVGENAMIVLTGIDRFLMLSVSSRYIAWRPKVYVSLMSCIAVAFGGLMAALPLLDVIATPDMILPFCNAPNIFGAKSAPYMYAYFSTVNIAVICVYFAVHLQLKSQVSSATSSAAEQAYLKRQKHMTQSLMVIVYCYFLGWVSALLLGVVGKEAADLKPATRINLLMLAAVFANINFMSNFPIFLQRSKEWRKAFRRLFRIQTTVGVGG